MMAEKHKPVFCRYIIYTVIILFTGKDIIRIYLKKLLQDFSIPNIPHA